jgi:hypothetical protein
MRLPLIHVVLVLFVAVTNAFSPWAVSSKFRTFAKTTTTKTIVTTTELNGIRSFFKRKFVQKRQSPPADELLNHFITPRTIRTAATQPHALPPLVEDPFHTSTESILQRNTAFGDEPRSLVAMAATSVSVLEHSVLAIETEIAIPKNTNAGVSAFPRPTTTATPPLFRTTTTAIEFWEDPALDQPYTLPEPDRPMTKLELEFREMLLDFSQFTPRDIRAVKNPRMRAVFEGVAASYSLPEVYRAFEVLFEDVAPLRIAGRLIYGRLKQTMLEAQADRQRDVQQVTASTGLSEREVEANRAAFLQLVVHRDDRATEMDIPKLVDTGVAETAVEVLGYADFDDFLEALQLHTDDKISFCDLMIGLQSCAVDSPRPECNPATVLPEVARRLTARSSDSSTRLQSSDQRKQSYIARYETMVSKFIEWKDFVPQGEGRLLDVLRGCFVGAKSRGIVNALRIVYVDYSALRMSGDLIFNLMSAIVGRRGEGRK